MDLERCRRIDFFGLAFFWGFIGILQYGVVPLDGMGRECFRGDALIDVEFVALIEELIRGSAAVEGEDGLGVFIFWQRADVFAGDDRNIGVNGEGITRTGTAHPEVARKDNLGGEGSTRERHRCSITQIGDHHRIKEGLLICITPPRRQLQAINRFVAPDGVVAWRKDEHISLSLTISGVSSS